MVKKKELIFIDSNVFIIDLRYKNDPLSPINKRFLDQAAGGNSATSVINLLEICGVLSFNLNEKQLFDLYTFLPQKYGIDILPYSGINQTLPSIKLKTIMDAISRQAALGDALIISVIEQFIPSVTTFVSWDADYFNGKLAVDLVVTPSDYLT